MPRLIAAMLVFALLAACSSPAPPVATTASSATPAPAATNVFAGTPLAPYGHDLNRAKNVQDVVNERARKENAALDAATGSSSGN